MKFLRNYLSDNSKLTALYEHKKYYLVIPVILLLLWGLYTEFHLYKHSSATISQSAKTDAIFYAENLHLRILSGFYTLRSISEGFMGCDINPYSPSRKSLHELRYLIKKDSGNFYSINIYSPSGNKIIWSTRKQSSVPIRHIAHLTPLTKISKNFILGDDVYSERAGYNVITMRYRVTDPRSGKTLYFIGGAYKLSRLLHYKAVALPFKFTVIDSRENSIYGILDDGNLIFHKKIYFNKEDSPGVYVDVPNMPIKIRACWPKSLVWRDTYLRMLFPRLLLYIISFITLIFSLIIISNLIDAIYENYKKQESISTKDPLTGIYNRRYFMGRLKDEINMAKRSGMPFSLIMADIDHFKQINDMFGHTSGDTALKNFTDIISRRMRVTDCFARYGGEEFIVLLPQTSLKNAAFIAEELRQITAKTKMHGIGSITSSFGVVEFNIGKDNFDTIINRVDDKLYEAKAAGRNRVAS